MIRKYAPNSKIVLGGYGTVLKDDVLKPYGDYICREEGVAYFRRLLGEPEIPMPYKHPLIVSWLKVFGWKVSGTGKIFAGLGCPNGCDFCCTSHFFSRKHIKLLPTGRDIYDVVERYFDLDPSLVFLIIDEDFLLNKKRAMEFRDCVLAGGKRPSIFAFSSIKAISQYTVEEILEMGIDGFWIGYEGTRSNYAKQQGRPVDGHPHRISRARHHHSDLDDRRVRLSDAGNRRAGTGRADEAQARAGAISDLRPGARHAVLRARHQGKSAAGCLHQRQGFVLPARGRVPHDDQASDAFAGANRGHPALVFRAGFPAARPEHLSRARNALARLPEAQRFAESRFAPEGRILRQGIAFCLSGVSAGRLLGPNATVRRWIGDLERRIHAELGQPAFAQRCKSVMAVGAALWTGFTLKLDLFQHPKLQRTTYRLPDEALERVSNCGRNSRKDIAVPNFSVQVELQHAKQQVWMRLEGALSAADAESLGAAPPRFAGTQQEPPGAGPEETPLGQGGGSASAFAKSSPLIAPASG